MIECAAVLPDEPEILYFSEYSTDPRVGATGWSRRYCIVEPDGTEQEIPGYYILSLADEYTRYCFMRQDESSVEGENCVYKLFSADEDISAYRNDPEWASFGTIGFRTNHLQVEELREGSLFKIVETYRMGEVWYRMTTVRKIDFLPPEPEIRVSLKTEPLGDGYSQAQFRAVVRPREGDGHDYYFGDPWQIYEEHPEAVTAQQSDGGGLLLDGISSFQSFCVRWYDADHNFLQEGWENVMPYSVQRWPFPSCSHEGRDFIIEYDGLVQSSSPNEDAAFYSLELNLMDLSTGWHYLIETEQVPITD